MPVGNMIKVVCARAGFFTLAGFVMSLLVTAYLVLGAISQSYERQLESRSLDVLWQTYSDPNWAGPAPRDGYVSTVFGCTAHTAIVSHTTGSASTPQHHHHIVNEFFIGWPFRCSTVAQNLLWQNGVFSEQLWGGITLSRGVPLRDGESARLIPTTLMAPGIIANTIFYGTVLWACVVAFGFVRRLIRQRRGLCPKCGYSVGPSRVCTECGTPITRRLLPT